MTKVKSKQTRPETVSPPVEKTHPDVIEMDATDLYLHKGEPCFWKGKILLNGSIVSGKVMKSQMRHFLELAPKDINLDKWVFPTDKIAERKKVAKEKMKAKLGLTD